MYQRKICQGRYNLRKD